MKRHFVFQQAGKIFHDFSYNKREHMYIHFPEQYLIIAEGERDPLRIFLYIDSRNWAAEALGSVILDAEEHFLHSCRTMNIQFAEIPKLIRWEPSGGFVRKWPETQRPVITFILLF